MGYADEQSSDDLRQRYAEYVERSDHCLIAAESIDLVGYALQPPNNYRHRQHQAAR